MIFTSDELNRYNRQIILPKFGMSAQEKLKNSSILVVGAGGLGCPALQYLAAAGINKIGIIDYDIVDESNLHRQVLFTEKDIGKKKAEVVKAKLSLQNSFIQIVSYPKMLTKSNVFEILRNYDIILDGSDNFATKYLLNDACIILNKILIFAAIYDFEGHVSVFNYKNEASYRCLFPEIPSADSILSCADHGVLGVLPGIIGTIQASEAIKVITGIGDVLSAKLFIFNLLTMKSKIIKFKRNDKNFLITELDNYNISCKNASDSITTITFAELYKMKTALERFQLIDVREEHEFSKGHLRDAVNFPLSRFARYIDSVSKTDKVVVYCQTGIRSLNAANQISAHNEKVYNLAAGYDAGE